MLISMATFEHLPVRIGGLAEAVTSLGESLSKSEKVMIFMPAHGLLHDEETNFSYKPEKYCDFRIMVGDRIYPVTVYQTERKGVRIFLFSSEVMDNPSVYEPREMFISKMVHFTKAVPGFINMMLKKERQKPDVIHINDWHCVFAGSLVKKYFKIPFVFTIHRLCHERISVHELNEVNLSELVDPRYLEGDMFNIEKFGGHHCDHLTTVSYSYLNEEWRTFFSTFEGKTTYVWNGTDFTFWNPEFLENASLPRPERRKLLLKDNGFEDGVLFFNVGRLDTEQKGIDSLLEAFEMIMNKKVPGSEQIRDKMRFVLLGSGDQFLENEAKRLEQQFPKNMKSIIAYLGREATREYYGSADFCLIPSNFEPFGLVQLEAMCMGCIPIGSRVGGINDTILDLHDFPEECTGRLVPPRNPTALARAMVEMAQMSLQDNKTQELNKMRLRGREHVIKNFNWDKAAERYIQVYKNMATIKLPFISYAEPY
ncbi:MAG: glycogen synthase [Firmicutes bacterium]|nr:glycogen synthase [Bacillota bacterium]